METSGKMGVGLYKEHGFAYRILVTPLL